MLYEDERITELKKSIRERNHQIETLNKEITIQNIAKEAAVKKENRKSFKHASKALDKLYKKEDALKSEIRKLTIEKNERGHIVEEHIQNAYMTKLSEIQADYNVQADHIREQRDKHAAAIQSLGEFRRSSTEDLLTDYRSTRKAHGLNPFGNVKSVEFEDAPLFEPLTRDVAKRKPLTFTQTQIRYIYQNEITGE